MADLDEQLPQECLVKIMMFVGVKYYRCLRFRLILAKRYSDEYDAFCSLLLLDERDRVDVSQPAWADLSHSLARCAW